MRTKALLLVLLIAACKTYPTKRVDPADDDEMMGTGLESGDVEAIGNLAKSLVANRRLTGPQVEEPPTVAIQPVENNTRFDFDSELLVRRIRQKLVEHAGGRIRFVSRSDMDRAIVDQERADKRSGEVTYSKLDKAKMGVDYYLTGTASSISKVGRGLESDAIYIDFRLIDAENGELVWEQGYKTKKIGKAGVVYR